MNLCSQETQAVQEFQTLYNCTVRVVPAARVVPAVQVVQAVRVVLYYTALYRKVAITSNINRKRKNE